MSGDLFDDNFQEESLFSFPQDQDVSTLSIVPSIPIPQPPSFDPPNTEFDELTKFSTSSVPQDFVSETVFASPLRDCLGPDFESTEFAPSPTPTEVLGKWENDLERLIRDFDSKSLPITDEVAEELIGLSVPKFHSRCKSLSLDKRTIEYLKSERKRLKNRQAAIRSRAKKEERVSELEKMVKALLDENAALKEKLKSYEFENMA